jgi:phenylalanyl-tRNA synthetase beta chain
VPSITVSYHDLCKLVGRQIESKHIRERLSMLGIEPEMSDDEFKLEITHNRPDLLSPEGVARALKGFLGVETGLPNYNISPSGIMIEVDQSTEQIRPFIAAGVVTNVRLTDEIVASLMQAQEKLHTSLCRNRRKGSIGVYDLAAVMPPVHYTTTLPESVRFVPLDFNRELTPAQIIGEHPKGIEYGPLIQDLPRYPLLIDSRGVVLSMPPIVNSENTRVTEKTKDFFIDVTGQEELVVNQALTIMMTGLAERGFELRSVLVKYPGRKIRTPNLAPKKRRLSARNTNEVIGLKLTPGGIAKIAKKMRYGVAVIKDDTLTILVPPYRGDIMHEIDLIEDIAVGYGYDKLEPTLPKVPTIGERASIEKVSDKARRALTGLGFTEVMTYTLTNPITNFKFMDTRGEAVEIANPVSEEYTIVRDSLLPSLLSVLRENRRHHLPHKIFEVGDVVVLDKQVETGAKNVRRAAAVVIGYNIGFTYIKAVAEALLRELGLTWEVRTAWHPSFLDGRVAELMAGDKRLGVIGELHPDVILAFELEHPVSVFEVDLG